MYVSEDTLFSFKTISKTIIYDKNTKKKMNKNYQKLYGIIPLGLFT